MEKINDSSVGIDKGQYWDEDFVGNILEEEARVVAKYFVIPESVNRIHIPKDMKLTDENVAKIYGQVEVDPKLQKLGFKDDQDIYDGGVIAYAKRLALVEAGFDSKSKSRFAEFGDKMLDVVGQVIAGVSRHKGLSFTVGLGLLGTAACVPMNMAAPIANVDLPDNTSVLNVTIPKNTLPQNYFETSETAGYDTDNTYIKFEGETHPYDAETQALIDSIKNEYGINVIMPKEFEGKTNMAWTLGQLEYVAKGLSLAPPVYFEGSGAPIDIILVRTPGTTNEGTGGNYNHKRVILYISEAYNPEAEFSAGNLKDTYGFQYLQEEKAVIHELGHGYSLFTNPDFQSSWTYNFGWHELPDGVWLNDHLETLSDEGLANKYPWEDTTESIARYAVKKNIISPDRGIYISSNPIFSTWATELPN